MKLYCAGEDISEKKEGILYRSVLEKGESYGGPNAGARCTGECVWGVSVCVESV